MKKGMGWYVTCQNYECGKKIDITFIEFQDGTSMTRKNSQHPDINEHKCPYSINLKSGKTELHIKNVSKTVKCPHCKYEKCYEGNDLASD